MAGRLIYVLIMLCGLVFAGTGLPGQNAVQQEYAKAVEHFQEGQLDLAEQEFLAALKGAPQSPEPKFFLGKIYQAKNQLGMAEDMLKEAIRVKPDFVEAYHSLGVVYLIQNKNEKAKEAFLETIRLKPENALAHLNLASAYLGLDKAQEGERELQRALELAPQNSAVGFTANFNLGLLYYRRREYPQALTYLEKARALNRENSEVLLSLCDSYFKLGRVKEGAALAQMLSELAARTPTLHLRLGLLLVENARYREAEFHLEQARELLPPTFELIQSLGTAYYYLGRYPDAQVELSRALALRPSPQTFFILGKAYLSQNDPRAIEAFQKCVHLDPAREDAWEELSRELTKRRAFDQAIETFQHYVEISPQNPFSHLLLGEGYYNKSSFTKALEQFQKALELDPNLARTYYSLGLVYKAVGKSEDAKTNFQRALRLNPESALTNYNLGEVLLVEKNYRQAILFLTRAIKLNADDPEFHFKLGQVYFLQRRYFEATEQLKKAVELRPDHAQAHYLLGRCYTAQSKPALAQAEYSISRILGTKATEKAKATDMVTR